ncbi:MAG: glycosyltransferase [Bacillota bacterium]|nr:glycosyltransferase [Bacillota bacterium]
MIFSGILILLGLVSGLLMLWYVPKAKALQEPAGTEGNEGAEGDKPGQRVSIIIPAYNEARRLPDLLASLKIQDIQPCELLVVDDWSSDETVTVARLGGAQVISSDPILPGWVGKSRACWSGAKAAQGDWLLFFDADTRLDHAGSLRQILQTYSELGASGGLSFQPYHTVRLLYESLSAIFNIIVMAGMSVFTPWGARLRGAGLFGPCLICRRSNYFAIGGHEAVRSQIMDDLALGQLFRKGGFPVHCYSGRGVLRFRMYSEGLGSLIEGWTKNFGSAASATHPLVLTMIILWICSGFSSVTLLLLALNGPAIWLAAGITAYLLNVLLMFRLARLCGNFNPLLLVLYPLLLAFFSVLFFWSLILTRIFHAVKWKGRKINV